MNLSGCLIDFNIENTGHRDIIKLLISTTKKTSTIMQPATIGTLQKVKAYSAFPFAEPHALPNGRIVVAQQKESKS